ncbi:hypothetical protein NA57DRAFT_29626 [Rhizodiscina lignyota]|uniref:Arrestin C-terminal-like domain-containing protein n=1 Tax=Rhizodiscina lignyota TaxID=1504668 RepID=A0A9P4IPX9_9PEZI|nr:hypothetical protein NA57DRAFT_29626 [Rhizodiscina lignyota]
MQSHHSLFWSPTQIGFVQVHSDRGRLFYLPYHLPREDPPGPGYFAGRSARPHRIHIARTNADHALRVEHRDRSRSSFSDLFEKSFDKAFGKLAYPRENAKRFLRAFIALPQTNPSTDDPLATAEPQITNPTKRRSWRGKRRSIVEAESMRTSARSSVVDPVASAGMLSRPSLDNATLWPGPGQAHGLGTVGRIPDDKPLASGNGVSVGISLAEPVLFLQGFEQSELSNRSTAMLRGSLHLKVTKATKIRAVTLKFKGQATTKWPEGIPPKKQETEETDTIMSHTWPFFNAQFPTAEFGSGADHVELTRQESPPDQAVSPAPTSRTSFAASHFRRSPMNSSTNLTKTAKSEHKRLSLQVNQSRSFGKGESPNPGPTVAQKGHRNFSPGDYIYNFELPLDSHIPETIDVELGSVKYELEATVERSGTFKSNLIGTKEVLLIRTPAEGSLEQVEPIAISRNWEDQLHYDIVISGKSFPLGAQVPIAFKLTPLAKVQCHRIKVFVTENVEYYCNNKRVHRMGGTRKVQLFEKRADGPSVSTFPGSSMRILSGGGLSYDQRVAAARGEEVTPPDTTNLLGDLENGSMSIGPTEMEFNVQLPSCTNMKDNQKDSKLHFDTTYQNIQVHHWIKIVMRLSKPDAENPGKRRHFEISIDSPFHILSCRATQANIALPAYSSPQQPGNDDARLYECGCPGAAQRPGSSPISYIPTLNNLNAERTSTDESSPPNSRTTSDDSVPGLARPQAAHISGANENLQRPMHLLRAPSFNPPAFEDEEPPPPLETPPPQYDSIASPTSGLADYFSRLSDAYENESEGSDTDREAGTPTGGAVAVDDGMMRGGRSRVRIPLTPGGRVNRSMDAPRTWAPVGVEEARV